MEDPQSFAGEGHPLQAEARVAHFGVFELDLGAAELRRAGARVRLQDQPFRLLALLLERPGELVTREELRHRLWPSEFVDFDHSLNAAVRKLREALGDSAESPRFVETLARRGYRFIAPVTWTSKGAAPPSRRVGRTIAAIAGAVVVLAGAIAFLVRRPPEPPRTDRIDAVAVLPFTNDDPASQHISDGVTEMLIDSLSRLPNLRVMARTTTFAYKGRTADPRDAGRALRVGAVVVGHLRRDGNRVAMYVELIRTSDGTQMWGSRFDTTVADLWSAQTRIYDEIAGQLRSGIRAERQRFSTDARANELYMKGMYAWNKRGTEDLKHAEEYFGQAIARDPNFAAAYAGLAQTYGVLVGYGRLSTAEGAPKVLAAAQKALQLEPDNAAALAALATTKYRNVWDFQGAESDYRHALAVNPNDATAHEWYADFLRTMGRWSDARGQIGLAYKLDPLSPAINSMMCYSFYYERRYREAIAFSDRAARLDPQFGSPSCVVKSLIALGDIPGAIAVLRTTPAGDRVCDQLFESYRRAGTRDFYRTSARLLTAATDGPDAIDVAAMYARAGDRDHAFAWLDRARENRVSRLTNVNFDPMFDGLRDDPRYDELLRKIGIPRTSPGGATF